MGITHRWPPAREWTGAYLALIQHTSDGNHLWVLGLNYKVMPLFYFYFLQTSCQSFQNSRVSELKREAFELTYLRCYSHQVHICRHTDLRCMETAKMILAGADDTNWEGNSRFLVLFFEDFHDNNQFYVTVPSGLVLDSWNTIRTCAGGHSAAVVTLTVYTFYIVNKWLPYVKYNLRDVIVSRYHDIHRQFNVRSCGWAITRYDYDYHVRTLKSNFRHLTSDIRIKVPGTYTWTNVQNYISSQSPQSKCLLIQRKLATLTSIRQSR